MPKVAFTQENKTESAFDFPRLQLEKGERARILLIQELPDAAFVHELRAPTIINGQPVMEQAQSRAGEMIPVPKMDFIGRHLCMGDWDTLQEKGIDVDNCPECREATTSDSVQPPKRRFLMHVIRYATEPQSFELLHNSPFSVRLLHWSFTDQRFNEIVEFRATWKDLKAHDLLLGPCAVKQFQKFDINVAPSAEWLSDATTNDKGEIALGTRGEIVKQTYLENKLDDDKMLTLIGRRVNAMQMEEDLAGVRARFRVLMGGGASAPTPATETEVQGVLDQVLGSEVPASSVVEPTSQPPGEKPSLDSLLESIQQDE